MIPVILSGGSGTRLWPLSRKQRPKQFLPILSEETLFQSTLSRLGGLDGVEAPLIVCNEDHRFMVAEQLRQATVEHQGIILEPIARNTAPAIALAALRLAESNSDATMLVLPADHVIQNIKAFHAAIEVANQVAHAGYLATFGIVPRRPETGYGYIHALDSLSSFSDAAELSVKRVKSFVEKPGFEAAKHYIDSGEYLWNSGMYLFKVDTYLSELLRYQPDVYNACLRAYEGVALDKDFVRVDQESFELADDISVDYAIKEHTELAAVVPLDTKWDDVGAWSAVWDIGERDVAGNVCRGDVQLRQAKNNLVYSDNRLVSLLGVDDLMVVDTQDALLVAHKNSVQDVKILVDELKRANRPEIEVHRRVDRPWGNYDSMGSGHRFQVKHIVVKPGATLSLQKHFHRAEHWIVVKGTAEVTKGENTFLLSENESVYIALGEQHRLANPGKLDLELIEVQSGSYLGEDDIVRFDDIYGRSGSCKNTNTDG